MRADGYVMPKPEKGDMVFWYAEGEISPDPMFAFVSTVGDRNLTLHVVRPNRNTFDIRDGVHHASDPLLKNNIHRREQGCWEYRPCDLARKELEMELLTATTARAA